MISFFSEISKFYFLVLYNRRKYLPYLQLSNAWSAVLLYMVPSESPSHTFNLNPIHISMASADFTSFIFSEYSDFFLLKYSTPTVCPIPVAAQCSKAKKHSTKAPEHEI
jgi:hypothetical protein